MVAQNPLRPCEAVKGLLLLLLLLTVHAPPPQGLFGRRYRPHPYPFPRASFPPVAAQAAAPPRAEVFAAAAAAVAQGLRLPSMLRQLRAAGVSPLQRRGPGAACQWRGRCWRAHALAAPQLTRLAAAASLRPHPPPWPPNPPLKRASPSLPSH